MDKATLTKDLWSQPDRPKCTVSYFFDAVPPPRGCWKYTYRWFQFKKVSFCWFLGEIKNEVGDKPKCCVLWLCSNSQHRKLCSKNPPLYFNIMAQYLWEKKVENLPNWLKEDPVGSPTVICCPGPPLTLLLRNKLDVCKSGGRACVEPPTVNCCLLKMPP